MFIYSQRSGVLTRNGIHIGTGYAGFGPGKNNPKMQDQHNVGPLPQGYYVIGAPTNGTRLGPLAMPLTPDSSNPMYGRSGFYMHDDAPANPGKASDGCIVQYHAVLVAVAGDSDRILQVVE